jgi:hypothetical protein
LHYSICWKMIFFFSNLFFHSMLLSLTLLRTILIVTVCLTCHSSVKLLNVLKLPMAPKWHSAVQCKIILNFTKSQISTWTGVSALTTQQSAKSSETYKLCLFLTSWREQNLWRNKKVNSESWFQDYLCTSESNKITHFSMWEWVWNNSFVLSRKFAPHPTPP